MSETRDATWVGRPLRRREDPELLSGKGVFIADVTRPGMLHAAFLRSPHAHARIRAIDAREARALPGVHAVLTGGDLPADLGPQPVFIHFQDERPTPTWALARERVRYVGEPVAAVAAESRYVAEDALERMQIAWEPLPAVADVMAALAPEAPRLYDGWPDNVAATYGTAMGDADRALAAAEVVIQERFSIQRNFACPIETRGVLAEWDAHRGDLVIWSTTQVLHQARDYLADILKVPVHRIRVIAPRLGGGFGAKFHFYAEEVAVALLAGKVRRPVRWIEDRLESFVTTVHAREQVIEATLGARPDGTITALSADILGDLGAHLHTVSMGPVWCTSVMLTGAYAIPNASVRVKGVVTNKTPLGSYRGWGQQQANFVIERLVDRLAARLGLDPVDVRRRNFIRPEQFPFQTLCYLFDSGRYADCLDRALEAFDYRGWRRRQDEGRGIGRHLGIGMSVHIDAGALGPSRILNMSGSGQGGYDIARLRMEPSGDVTLYTGLCDMGQGLTNALAQVAADALGVRPESIYVVTGDTQVCPYTGYGTGGSRGGTTGGAAVLKAAERLREKILRIGAHLLEAAPQDLVINDGRISVGGAPWKSVALAEVGRAAYHLTVNLPDGVEPGLDAVATWDPPNFTFAYGVNVAVVEVDSLTGEVHFLDYVMVHDSGTLLNPLVVEGQVHGGIAQGIGQALWEELRYNAAAQPMSRTFMDYVMATAADLPRFRLNHTETPAPHIPGGMKGVGEGAIMGPPAAVVNAIEDALRPFGPTFTTLPVTPERILSALRGAAVMEGRA
jgi:aerobic carbon-monoxide dehydrogenase large subunit